MGTWSEENFALTSIEIEAIPDGGFLLRQQKLGKSTGTDVSEPAPFSSRHCQVDTR